MSDDNNSYDVFCADELDKLACLLSKAADMLREPKPKPKGKNKTFLKKKLEDAASAHYWEDPYTNFDDAVDYWKCNPGSILEIVVRKPGRSGGPEQGGK